MILKKVKIILENNLIIVWIAPIVTGIILALLLNIVDQNNSPTDDKLTGYQLYKAFMRNPEQYGDEKTTLHLKSVSPEYGTAPKYVCTALGLEYGDAIYINVSVGDNDSKYDFKEIISLYASGRDLKYIEEIAKGEAVKIEVQFKQFYSTSYESNNGLCRRLLFISKKE